MASFSVVILTARPPGLGASAEPTDPLAAGGYIKIDGRESLMRSVELFLNRDAIKQKILVVDSRAADEAKRKFGAHLGFSGVKLVSAGSRWSEQLAAAGQQIATEITHVILHDAARPAVAYSDIDALLREAEGHAAVALVAPIRTGLVELDEGGSPIGFAPAERYAQVLMPQAFKKETFLALAKSGELHASQYTLLKGSPYNIRVGTPGDAGLAKNMLHLLPRPKIKAPTNPFGEAEW
ncbi:MAG TPA: 2-C-methyl-D-erythritol 4-phosphate cytidylyltransferase [Tepidisphaeraceae bacterium]|jgi:2-C-methyl-D-erythritol 4-phosphate cytidylyltransferase|nr:2-C-methyl-D-erythritol 4-phosphate cytidylyltransferase [Tepidisphaeraceae bacterium]